MSNGSAPTGDELTILLEEYGKTQESAQHHDTLLWTVVGILFSGIAALFGFALQYFDGEHPKWQFGLIAILGMLSSALISFFVASFAGIRKQKYCRCRQIERRLVMRNHLGLKRWYPQRAVMYTISGLFFLTWLVLLCVRLSQASCPTVCDPRCTERHLHKPIDNTGHLRMTQKS